MRQQIDEACADDRVAAESHAGALAETQIARLPDRFVGQGAAATHHANLAGVVNVAGHDADLAATGRDDSGTIRTNQNGIACLDLFVDANHVEHGHPFGDRRDDSNAGIDCFENRIGGERWRNENHRRIGAGLLDRLFDGIKNGDPFDVLAALARRDAADHLGAVVAAAQRVKRPRVAGDALADDLGVSVNQDAHD